MAEVAEPTHQKVHDPVCHMNLPADEAAGSTEYGGLTYYFCSDDCMRRFEADPAGIIEAETQHAHEPNA